MFVVHRHPEWWVKIGDFGIAKRVQNEDTELRTEVGTRNFKAPEVQGLSAGLESTYEYTNSVDIWAVGCVAHWILTQKVPFDSFATLFMYVEQDGKFPERAMHVNSVSDAGIEFIESLMARRPSERLTARAALETDWIKDVDLPIPPQANEGPDERNFSSPESTPNPIIPLPEHKGEQDDTGTNSTQSTGLTESSTDLGSAMSSITLASPVQYDVPGYQIYIEAAKKAADGRTPLHLASWAGDDHAVEQLISNGAEVDAEDDVKQTALHRSCKRGRVWVADILLRSGADVNARGQDGETPLWLAAWQGHVDVALTLISNGADLELRTDRDANGARYTPLIVAARNERREMVRLLLRKGTDISAKDAYGNTALHHAIQKRDKEMVMLLVESNADLASKNDIGQTALHLATINIPALLAYLKRRGADIECRDINDYTPLHLAAGSGANQGTEYLIMSGANVKAKTAQGDTPLLLAARGGLQPMIELLLSHEADIEEANYAGRTALLEAAALDDTSTIRFLLEKGANVNARDRRGATALIIASSHYGAETVELFLAFLELEATSKDGTTALLEAAESGSLSAVELLIDRGANIEAKDSRGNTPLLRAASAGWESVTEALIEAGADINAKNSNDETALQVAERTGRSSVANVLKQEVGKRKIAALVQPRG
jgi:ankyrin repeat protein